MYLSNPFYCLYGTILSTTMHPLQLSQSIQGTYLRLQQYNNGWEGLGEGAQHFSFTPTCPPPIVRLSAHDEVPSF